MTDTTNLRPLRVDIISDVVCPWCAVGYGQLAMAARRSGAALDIHWQPFELNPDMAPEGENLREHLAAKYGSTAEQSAQIRSQLTELGTALGFDFRFGDDMRIYNTFQAHQLIEWAETQGKGHEMKQALLKAYFTDGKDVSDPQVLVQTAEGLGLDAAEAFGAGQRRTRRQRAPARGLLGAARHQWRACNGVRPPPPGDRRTGRRDLRQHSGTAGRCRPQIQLRPPPAPRPVGRTVCHLRDG